MEGSVKGSLIDNPDADYIISNSTTLKDSEISNSLFIYLTSALVAVCYLLASIVCCRCYWQHLKKSTTGGLEPLRVSSSPQPPVEPYAKDAQPPEAIELSSMEKREFHELE